jgi:hypothetical protein
MVRNRWMRWVQDPPVTGWFALLSGIAAVALPTAVRAAINGSIAGCEFTPYLPFVLVSALALGWRQAGLVAMASVAVLGGFFVGSPNPLSKPCFISGGATFLAASSMIILVAVGIRRMISGLQHGSDDEGGIIFSREKGKVWASWYGNGPPICLGSERRVGSMMEDYLAQVRLAKRLDRESD